MARSIQLSTQVLAAMKAEQEALPAEKEAKDLAIREATIDVLTGLQNRRCLLAYLTDRMVHPSGRSAQLGLLFVNLDRFKHIHDVDGHGTVDAYLQAVGQALAQ
jgi:GGDEF domain-containing protein